MGTFVFYGTIHIKRRQTSKETITKANANAIAHPEWALIGVVNVVQCTVQV